MKTKCYSIVFECTFVSYIACLKTAMNDLNGAETLLRKKIKMQIVKMSLR